MEEERESTSLVRAPFQVLVIPFLRAQAGIEYAIFRRADTGDWQGIAGGGEGGETPLEAARREATEEAGIPDDSTYVTLDAASTVPVARVVGSPVWGPGVRAIPEFCFGVAAARRELALSREHTEYRWVSCDKAMEMLRWDSNKEALQELNRRLLVSSENVPDPYGGNRQASTI